VETDLKSQISDLKLIQEDSVMKPSIKKKGLILVFTGDGKGKTTAAMGTVLRMISHGKKVGMVQFFKSKLPYVVPCAKFKAWNFGGGFTWQVPRSENVKAVQKAWKKCAGLLRSPEYNLVIFDEIHVALRHKFLKVSDVVQALKCRRPGLHVILTGRDAPQAIVHFADLVTEMKCVKHPFDRGIPAQAGIEF
jgi:cob(I)alamin adenosyltransferase